MAGRNSFFFKSCDRVVNFSLLGDKRSGWLSQRKEGRTGGAAPLDLGGAMSRAVEHRRGGTNDAAAKKRDGVNGRVAGGRVAGCAR